MKDREQNMTPEEFTAYRRFMTTYVGGMEEGKVAERLVIRRSNGEPDEEQ
jgi:hypothetical protein